MTQQAALRNGLRVVVETKDIELCHLYVAIGVGSMDEPERGLAHFLEHCIFNGTKSWPEEMDVWEMIESSGGKINAFTTKDNTTIFSTVLASQLDRTLALISEMIFLPRFDEDDIEREKRIVLSELQKSRSGLEIKANRLMLESLLPGHPVRHEVVGTPESITKFNRPSMAKFHQDFYVPSNIAIAIVGNIKIDEAIRYIEKRFSHTGPAVKRDRPGDPKVERVIREEYAKGNQSAVILGARTPGVSSPLNHSIQILTHALGNMSTFGLRAIIRFHHGLAYTVTSAWNSYSSGSHLVAFARCSADNVEEIFRQTVHFIDVLKEKALNETTLKRVVMSYKGKCIEEEENPATRAKRLSHLLLNNSLELADSSAYLEKTSSIDINKLANDLLNNYAIIKIWPE